MPPIQPYLFFNGRCEEALDFYQRTLGAEVKFMMRYKDSPEPMPPGSVPQGLEDKVMHVSFEVRGSPLMASDGDCSGTPEFKGFSLSLTGSDVNDAQRLFAALADGGTVTMPLAKTFWAPLFGMVTDRFGVSWMIDVAA
jgi:PhnB protein